jgi:hypothetical protein
VHWQGGMIGAFAWRERCELRASRTVLREAGVKSRPTRHRYITVYSNGDAAPAVTFATTVSGRTTASRNPLYCRVFQ